MAVIANCGGYNLVSRFEQLPALTRGAFTDRLQAANEAEAREKLAKFNLEGVVEKSHLSIPDHYGTTRPASTPGGCGKNGCGGKRRRGTLDV